MIQGMMAFLLSFASFSAPTQEPPNRAPKVRGGAEDLLAAVPADAALVITVRDLASFDAKLKDLSQRLGFLPVSFYQLAKGQLEIVAGIEDHGSVALLVMPSKEPGSVARNMPLLLPTTDRTEMLNFLKPRPDEPGYTRVTLRGRESYAGSKGPFTVLGAELATVKSVVAARGELGSRFSAYQRKRFADNDVSIWVHTPSLALSPLAELPPVRYLRSLGLGGDSPARWESVQLSLRLEPDGIAVELYFKQSDPTGATLMRGSTESLLRGLPGEPFVLAMGLAGDTTGTQLASTARLVVSGAGALGVIDPARSEELREAIGGIAAKTGDVSFSVAALPESPSGLVGLTKVVRVRGDGGALMDELDTILRILGSDLFVNPAVNLAMKKLVHRRAAETSGGVSIDHLRLDVSEFKTVDEAALSRAVGKEGLLLRIGVVDKKYMVATLGGGLPRFDAVVATVRANRAPLSTHSGIQESARKLPPRRWLEGYLAVDRLVALIGNVSRAMDLSTDVPTLPELDAPMSWSVRSVGREAVQVDLFIPLDLVTALKDLAMQQAAKQMSFGRP